MSLTKPLKAEFMRVTSGPTSSSGSCAQCLAPWSSTAICQRIPELAGLALAHGAVHRFTLNSCVTNVKGWSECYAACYIVRHDRFGGGSVDLARHIHGGIDLDIIDDGTLTAIRFRYVILRPIVRPFCCAVGPGFLPVRCNGAKVYRQFLEDEGTDTIDLPPSSVMKDVHV